MDVEEIRILTINLSQNQYSTEYLKNATTFVRLMSEKEENLDRFLQFIHQNDLVSITSIYSAQILEQICIQTKLENCRILIGSILSIVEKSILLLPESWTTSITIRYFLLSLSRCLFRHIYYEWKSTRDVNFGDVISQLLSRLPIVAVYQILLFVPEKMETILPNNDKVDKTSPRISLFIEQVYEKMLQITSMEPFSSSLSLTNQLRLLLVWINAIKTPKCWKLMHAHPSLAGGHHWIRHNTLWEASSLEFDGDETMKGIWEVSSCLVDQISTLWDPKLFPIVNDEDKNIILGFINEISMSCLISLQALVDKLTHSNQSFPLLWWERLDNMLIHVFDLIEFLISSMDGPLFKDQKDHLGELIMRFLLLIQPVLSHLFAPQNHGWQLSMTSQRDDHSSFRLVSIQENHFFDVILFGLHWMSSFLPLHTQLYAHWSSIHLESNGLSLISTLSLAIVISSFHYVYWCKLDDAIPSVLMEQFDINSPPPDPVIWGLSCSHVDSSLSSFANLVHSHENLYSEVTEFREILRESIRDLLEKDISICKWLIESCQIELSHYIEMPLSCATWKCEALLHACSSIGQLWQSKKRLVNYSVLNSLFPWNTWSHLLQTLVSSPSVVNNRLLARVVVNLLGDLPMMLPMDQWISVDQNSTLNSVPSCWSQLFLPSIEFCLLSLLHGEKTARGSLYLCLWDNSTSSISALNCNNSTCSGFVVPFRLKEDHIGCVSIVKLFRLISNLSLNHSTQVIFYHLLSGHNLSAFEFLESIINQCCSSMHKYSTLLPKNKLDQSTDTEVIVFLTNSLQLFWTYLVSSLSCYMSLKSFRLFHQGLMGFWTNCDYEWNWGWKYLQKIMMTFQTSCSCLSSCLNQFDNHGLMSCEIYFPHHWDRLLTNDEKNRHLLVLDILDEMIRRNSDLQNAEISLSRFTSLMNSWEILQHLTSCVIKHDILCTANEAELTTWSVAWLNRVGNVLITGRSLITIEQRAMSKCEELWTLFLHDFFTICFKSASIVWYDQIILMDLWKNILKEQSKVFDVENEFPQKEHLHPIRLSGFIYPELRRLWWSQLPTIVSKSFAVEDNFNINRALQWMLAMLLLQQQIWECYFPTDMMNLARFQLSANEVIQIDFIDYIRQIGDALSQLLASSTSYWSICSDSTRKVNQIVDVYFCLVCKMWGPLFTLESTTSLIRAMDDHGQMMHSSFEDILDFILVPKLSMVYYCTMKMVDRSCMIESFFLPWLRVCMKFLFITELASRRALMIAIMSKLFLLYELQGISNSISQMDAASFSHQMKSIAYVEELVSTCKMAWSQSPTTPNPGRSGSIEDWWVWLMRLSSQCSPKKFRNELKRVTKIWK